jgi:hypothetical protein
MRDSLRVFAVEPACDKEVTMFHLWEKQVIHSVNN